MTGKTMAHEKKDPLRATRPAILIGHGAFGRSALVRLLVGAALRGRLEWRAGDGGDDERRLRDLAVLWWPDAEDGDEVALGDGSSGLELMRDLDRQIQTVEAAESTLAETVEKAAARLLSAAERLRRDDALPLGLDVVVLARPRRAEVIGRLDRVLDPVLERLGAKKVLSHGFQGADKLGFLQILDFEDYWHPGAEAQRVREALAASAAHWRQRARVKEPAFGRIFLVDGQTEDGVKFAKDRLDEVVLFLELLLFEGLRDGPLQRLYQRQRDDEAPVATFGVRVFERSSGLLARLAAARFAVDWLEHLDGADSLDPSPTSIENLLAPLEGDGLLERLAFEGLRGEVDDAFARLEVELSEVAAERADWPEEIARLHGAATTALERRLDAELTRLLAEQKPWLDGLPEALGRAADEDLAALDDQDLPRNPSPRSARVVLAQLDRWRRRLASPRAARSKAIRTPQGDPDALGRLAALSRRYRSFRDDQLRPDGARGFWPLWALALAGAGAPGLLSLLATVPAPDPKKSHHLLVWAHQMFEKALGPVSVSLVLGLGALGAGLLLAQPRLARGVERGRRFFVDAARGRFVDRLRRDVAPGGGLRRPVEAWLEVAGADREAGVRGRLVRALDQLRRRLRERRREMAWLRDQLAELLRVHGLGRDDRRADGELLRQGSGVRRAAERVGDVRRLLASNPPGPERFRSMQSSERPLAGWRDPDRGTFLRPLDFLDELSRRFHDPESTGGAVDVLDLLDFLDRHHAFELSFPWHASDEVPVDEALCLRPRELATLEVARRLREIGISEERWIEIDDPSRVYLLRVQLGVAPERLTGAASARSGDALGWPGGGP